MLEDYLGKKIYHTKSSVQGTVYGVSKWLAGNESVWIMGPGPQGLWLPVEEVTLMEVQECTTTTSETP